MRSWRFSCWLGVAFAGLGATDAIATPVGGLAPPVIEINGTALDLNALNCSSRNGRTTCGGQNLLGDVYELESWSLVLNPDPSIIGTWNLTNLSAITQTFVLTVTLPIAPIGPSLSVTGSIGAGTLTDLNANGATLTDDGSSIYSALIDGSSVHTLLDPSQSYSAPADPLGRPSTVLIPAASFGPNDLAQAANSTISARTQFRLTAGDNVSLPLTFGAQAVPEPSTALLLGSGLVGLAVSRRRLRSRRAG